MLIRSLHPDDRQSWERLYRGYAGFYRVETSDDKLATLFDWLMDPAHPCNGLVAEDEGEVLIALAHYREMPSPLRGENVDFLDDLFVDPAARGSRAGEAMLRHLDGIAGEQAGLLCAGSPETTIIVRAVFMTGWRTGLTGSPMR